MTFTVRAAVGLALAAVVALSLGAVTAQAQKPQSGTEFYLAYKAAFDKATKIEDIYPFMAAARLAEMKATPAEDRKMMFDMIKSMCSMTGALGAGRKPRRQRRAMLYVEGVGEDKSKQTGTITLVKEAGAWKVDKESWKSN